MIAESAKAGRLAYLVPILSIFTPKKSRIRLVSVNY
jgi:hypothetical protein